MPGGSLCVPKGLVLVHLSSPCVNSAKQDLLPVLKKLFKFSKADESKKPQILWSCFYNSLFIDPNKEIKCTTDKLHVVNNPIHEAADYDHCVDEAKKLFGLLYPHEEFLPAAPDAEDIIIEYNQPIGTEPDQ